MRTRKPVRSAGSRLLAVGALAFLGLIILSGSARHWLQERLSSDKPHVFIVRPFPGVGPTARIGSPYPMHDSWGRFLPAPDACAGSTSDSASVAVAERAMICVLNYARVRDGLTALPVSPLLQRSARLKALDIVRCQQFSHAACGKDPDAVADEVDYPNVDWGENIYAGPGPYRPALVAADGWLNSPHHRENLFRDGWTEQGVAVVVAKRFKGQRDVAIWVSEFGGR
jgi:uncharacterized protein YkwD